MIIFASIYAVWEKSYSFLKLAAVMYLVLLAQCLVDVWRLSVTLFQTISMFNFIINTNRMWSSASRWQLQHPDESLIWMNFYTAVTVYWSAIFFSFHIRPRSFLTPSQSSHLLHRPSNSFVDILSSFYNSSGPSVILLTCPNGCFYIFSSMLLHV